MSRPIFRWAAVAQIALVIFTGCHPTQPFFVARDESLANYISESIAIEYADVTVESLPEATQSAVPLGPDQLPEDFVELSLEDCVIMALQNTKILRVINGSNTNSGSVAATLLSAAPGALPSIYDPALLATTASPQPLAVDGQGNRIAPRGLIRSNQVGGVEDALSEFDAQFSALFGYNTTDRPRNVGQGNVFNPQLFQGVDSNARAALSKRMATGTVATARFTTVYSRNNIPASGNAPNSSNFGRAVPSDYTTALELQITQPLLRGRGTLVNRIPVVLARINEDIEVHEFEANVRNLVKQVEHLYWDLYCGYRALETAKIAQSTALDLWRVAQARTQIGDTPPESEAQARALYHQFRAQVHASLYGSRVPGSDIGGIYGREQALREMIGWAASDGRLIRPSDEPSVARIQFDWHSIQAEALTRNTELRLHKWAIKQRELELVRAKNEILPQLDLTTFYRFVGVGDEFANADRNGLSFPNPGSTAIEELTGGDYQEVGAQVELTPHAFGKRRALANIQNSQIALVKFQEELKEKENLLMHELSRSWREMDATYVAMKDHLDQWIANEDEIGIYRDKIENDVGQLNQLLDLLLRAEERRSRAQLLYYQAVCEYNKSMVNIHYLKGSLLDLNSIALEEGPWADKAYWDAEERAAERAGGIYFDYGYTRPGVVSRGPVPSGTITEGNRSVPGAATDAYTPDMPGEYLPTEEVEAVPQSEGSNSLRDNAEPQPSRRGGPTAALPGVRPAAAEIITPRQASAPRYDWGRLGLASDDMSSVESRGQGQQPTSGRARQSIADAVWQSR